MRGIGLDGQGGGGGGGGGGGEVAVAEGGRVRGRVADGVVSQRRLKPSELARALDLRVATGAAAADLICTRAEYLPLADRDLLWSVYRHGVNVAELARASRRCRKTMSRRVKALVTRLNDPCFILVIARAGSWETRLAAVARQHYVQGRTLRAIAGALGLSYAQVRAARDVVRGLLSTAQREALAKREAAPARVEAKVVDERAAAQEAA